MIEKNKVEQIKTPEFKIQDKIATTAKPFSVSAINKTEDRKVYKSIKPNSGANKKYNFSGNRKTTQNKRPMMSPKSPINVHPVAPGKVRIIPVGGIEEVGRNLTIVECGEDIVILDAGFQFPGEDTPGIDYLVPNTEYLEANKSRIRGIIISHAHLDHVGALPYIIERLGNPVIYSTKLTNAMIKRRHSEFPHLPEIQLEEITSSSKIQLGRSLKASFFNITHTVPDAIGIIIETKYGNILYPGDFKIDTDGNGNPIEVSEYIKLGKENNLALLMESTNSEAPGFSMSENVVHENFKRIFKSAEERIIVGTFSSQLERIMEIISIAEDLDKKVFIDGRSMKDNVAIAEELKLFKPKKGTILPVEQINDFPQNKVIAVCTGAQGEKNAALMRIASNRHKDIKITPKDTVILSSSVIPGNETSVQALKDKIARQGAKIIHHGIADVHATGHAYQEELKLMIKMLNPKFFIPVHGYYFMRKINTELAKSLNIPDKNICLAPDNGSVIETDGKTIEVLKKKVPSNYVMVDGLGVGDVQEVVMRDRQMLSQDGIFVIIATIDAQTGKVKSSPDIISRGFIYLRESQDLLKQTRFLIKKTIEDATGKMHPINASYVKEQVREKVGKFLFQKTKRRPMLLPVLLEV